VKIARDEFGFTKSDISIDKLIERFLEYNRTNHRQSTTRRYKAVTDHLRNYLAIRRLDIIAVSQLTTEVIDGYKTYRKDSLVTPNGKLTMSNDNIQGNGQKGPRARTINLELDGIKTMLNLAIRWGYLKENPMKQVKPLKVEDSEPVRFLNQDECQKFLEACSSDLYPIYFTFLNTGMRKAELENLTWADINFERGKILIRRKEGWHPKTGGREIPISDTLMKVLQELRQRKKKADNTEYVFAVRYSGRSHNMLRNELIRIAKEAGIKNLTKVHTLRHTFASLLVMSGVDLPTVMKLMGYSDIQTTMIYAHLAPDHLADTVNKLSF